MQGCLRLSKIENNCTNLQSRIENFQGHQRLEHMIKKVDMEKIDFLELKQGLKV